MNHLEKLALLNVILPNAVWNKLATRRDKTLRERGRDELSKASRIIARYPSPLQAAMKRHKLEVAVNQVWGGLCTGDDYLVLPNDFDGAA